MKCLATALVAATCLFANDIPVFSTGQGASNGRDTHYNIILDTTGNEGSGNPFLVTIFPRGWVAAPQAQWVAPSHDMSNDANPGNLYQGSVNYTTTFSMNGLEPSSASLTLVVTADDYVTVLFNGKRVFSPTIQMFASPTTITINSGFISGTNTLEFDVANAGGGPTGLSVYAKGSADPVVTGSPTLSVSPTFVTLSNGSVAGTNQNDIIGIFVKNTGGGGPQKLTVSPSSANPNCTNVGGFGFFSLVSPTTTSQTAPAFSIRAFTIDPGGTAVKPGFYRADLRVTMSSLAQPDQTADVCLNYLVTNGNSGLSVSKAGLTFNAQTNVGTSLTQFIPVVATGASSDWTVTAISKNNFLNIVSPASGGGTSSPGSPGGVSVGVNPQPNPGSYYGVVTVTPKNSALAPSVVTVVYNVTATAPQAAITPSGGIIIASPDTGAQPLSLNLLPSTNSAQTFSLSTLAPFLSLLNPSGALTGTAAQTAQLVASVAKLAQGFNRGTVSVTLPGGNTRTLDILALLLPPGAKASGTTNSFAAAPAEDATSNCTPSQMAVVATSVAGGFSQPAGWPMSYQAQVIDDCANPVTNAKVVLSFSNGDAPVTAMLDNPTSGTYSATWAPGKTGPVTITVNANNDQHTGTSLTAATTTVGSVTSNQAPVAALNGTVNNLYPQLGSAVAPGTVASVFGSGLASAASAPSQLPLPTAYQGTTVLIGGRPAPLYYVSDGQVNIQVPTELTPNAKYPVVVLQGDAISVPTSLTVANASPAIAAFPDGSVIAQHTNFQLVDAAHPAAPGEAIIMYLVGMGATNPPLATGQQAPGLAGEPLATVKAPVNLTVDGKPATLYFAGLAPGGIGLYQVIFYVPQGITTSGLKNITLTEVPDVSVSANATTIPVAVPAASSAHP